MFISTASNQQNLPSFIGIIPKTLIWLNFRLLIVLLIGLVLLPANWFWHSNSSSLNATTSIVHAPDATFTLGGIRSITFAAVGGIIGGRLLLPFINRAMMTVAGGSVGVTTGPAGMIVGATAGLAIDWLMLQGTELLTRPQFEYEVLETVNLTKETLKNKLLLALLDTVDVQHQDLVQLLLKY